MSSEIQSNNNNTKFEFGSSFQYKIITNILTDKSFANNMLDLLKPQYFSTNSMMWICSHIQSYMITYKKTPTTDALKILIQTDIHDISNEQKQQIYIDLNKILSYTEADDLHFVQDQSIIFCKNEELAHAIYKSVDYLKNRDFEAIKATIDNALKKGTSSDIGMIYDANDAVEYRYSINRGKLLSTPWPPINEITKGGFGAGELIVFVAPSGVGKSWLLQYIGANLIENGHRVVHYTLELPDSYTGIRYDKILLKEDTLDKNNTPTIIAKKLKEKIKKHTNSVIKEYPTKTATVNTLRSHLDKMIINGYKPDAIIIDYADLLKPTMYNKEAERFNIDEIYKELRGMAKEYECPIFTASQTNRGAINKDIITEESIAESYGKIAIADFIMTLSSTDNDIIDNDEKNPYKKYGRVHIAKNRFGDDGVTYNCGLNFATGLIDIFVKNTPGNDNATAHNMNDKISIRNNDSINIAFSNSIEEYEQHNNKNNDLRNNAIETNTAIETTTYNTNNVNENQSKNNDTSVNIRQTQELIKNTYKNQKF